MAFVGSKCSIPKIYHSLVTEWIISRLMVEYDTVYILKKHFIGPV